MAGATIRMTANKQNTLQEIHEKIHCIKGAKQVSKSVQTIKDVTVWTLAYEKYYYRTGSYTSVTIVLTEHGQEQTACVVASGGGSYGANHNFAKACAQVLESCGFSIIESDMDMHGKGFAEQFLK